MGPEQRMTGAMLRVCYFGTYRANYSRNRIMIEGLRRNSVEVLECHEPLWGGIEDRLEIFSGGWRHPAFWFRVLAVYVRLLRKYWAVRDQYDIMVVGYPGQFDVFLARLLSWWQGKPLVWDIFMSIWLIAVERKLDLHNRLVLNFVKLVERYGCQLPNGLIVDTVQYSQWFSKSYGINLCRFRLVPTGADSDQFKPTLVEDSQTGGVFLVLYYGSFIPNHDVLSIVRAAHLLRDDTTIFFEMIGDGPDRLKADNLVRELALRNITFTDWLSQAELVDHMRKADVCLGAFGMTPQSLMTVQNKVYEALAVGKPVITGDGPAIRDILHHGKEIMLCPRLNATAIADSIRLLKNDCQLRLRIAENGHRRFLSEFTIEKIGALYKSHLLDQTFGSK